MRRRPLAWSSDSAVSARRFNRPSEQHQHPSQVGLPRPAGVQLGGRTRLSAVAGGAPVGQLSSCRISRAAFIFICAGNLWLRNGSSRKFNSFDSLSLSIRASRKPMLSSSASGISETSASVVSDTPMQAP